MHAPPATPLVRLAVFLLPALAGCRPEAPPPDHLNVLVIIADDLNTELGCYGNPRVRSPQIDRLAARGIRFEHAYCQFPLCNPSRTSLLSGRTPASTRVWENAAAARTALDGVPFLPEWFHQHGYATARVGKIAHDETAVQWDLAEDGRGKSEPGRFRWDKTRNRDRDEPDGARALAVVRLIEQHRDKPFFIAAGFHAPHAPFVAPRRYFALYPPESIPIAEEPAADRADFPDIARTRPRKLSPAQRRHAVAAYYACVSFLDTQVGLILDALERNGLAERTVVVFMSDNGFHLGDHGNLWGKATLFEESARVPLIIALPRTESGGRACAHPVELIDLYPTLVELCGLAAPRGLEGKSLAPWLLEPSRPSHAAARTVLCRRGSIGRSLRTERYRYTVWEDGDAIELYDHRCDPHELVNLADEPGHEAEINALNRQLDACCPLTDWRVRVGRAGRSP